MKDRGSDCERKESESARALRSSDHESTHGPIDTMAETAQQGRLVLDLLDESRDVLDRSDLDEHSDHSFVGSSVSRSVERSTGGTGDSKQEESAFGSKRHVGKGNERDDGVGIDSRRTDLKSTGSGSVHLVVCMENEESIEGFG